MSKTIQDFANKGHHLPSNGKIKPFDNFLTALYLDLESDYEKIGLVKGIHCNLPIRVRCPKCNLRRYHNRPRVYKTIKGLIRHLYSPKHNLDALEFPEIDQCIKLVESISIGLQMHLIGEKI